MNNPLDDFYFWFDSENGELEALVEEEFMARIEEIRRANNMWENIIA